MLKYIVTVSGSGIRDALCTQDGKSDFISSDLKEAQAFKNWLELEYCVHYPTAVYKILECKEIE